MPKFNKFSGLNEPDKTVFIEPSEEHIAKFREAQLKLDRISHGNEEELAFKLCTMAMRFNTKGEHIDLDLDYADAMSVLEDVFNETEANRMILALEEIAKEYGYVPEMDNESVTISQEKKWETEETFEGLILRIQRDYANADEKEKESIKNNIASGMRMHKITTQKNPRTVKRGQLWRVELPHTVGWELSGNRWAIVLSNDIACEHSTIVTVAYLVGHQKSNAPYLMSIQDTDLLYGQLEKPSSVSLSSINSIDKRRFLSHEGKFSNEFMNRLSDCIKSQLGL